MMRALSMESERKFRDKERSKLVKWIGYSDNFEKIYDDPDFSTIKEKAKERQALKDLENARPIPRCSGKLEAKRKAEEEALHRARTSSAALARAAKARWAQVQERMAATADREAERTARTKRSRSWRGKGAGGVVVGVFFVGREGSQEEWVRGRAPRRGDRGRRGPRHEEPPGAERGRRCRCRRTKGEASSVAPRATLICWTSLTAPRERALAKPSRTETAAGVVVRRRRRPPAGGEEGGGVPWQRVVGSNDPRVEKARARARAPRHAASQILWNGGVAAPGWPGRPRRPPSLRPPSMISSKGSLHPSETTTGTAP